MDLQLAVKREYFDAMKSGEKIEEYRLYNDYWKRRLSLRGYERLIITLGYPKKGDPEKTIVLPYRGFSVKKITHQHFGPEPVEVFALALTNDRGTA